MRGGRQSDDEQARPAIAKGRNRLAPIRLIGESFGFGERYAFAMRDQAGTPAAPDDFSFHRSESRSSHATAYRDEWTVTVHCTCHLTASYSRDANASLYLSKFALLMAGLRKVRW